MQLTSNGIPTDKYMQLRLVSVNQVLGTDMKKHFDITSRFQVSLQAQMTHHFKVISDHCMPDRHHKQLPICATLGVTQAGVTHELASNK